MKSYIIEVMLSINVNFSDFKRQLSHYIVLEPCEFG